MKRILLLVAVSAAVSAGTAPSSIPPTVQDALSTIDTPATQAQINVAFTEAGSDAVDGLPDIAQNASDTGIRLRAIHALVYYCPPISATDPRCDPNATPSSMPHLTLVNIVNANAMAQSGPELLVLRAAIESLGTLRVSDDYFLLTPFLNHNSRDIRATTARALGDLCNTNAVKDLRARTQFETVDQVKLAISSALRALSSCSP